MSCLAINEFLFLWDRTPMRKTKPLFSLAAALLISTSFANTHAWGQTNAQNSKLLADKTESRLSLKANLGYIYGFGGKWAKSTDNSESKSLGASAVGYGASLGYTHRSGFGISADYLGFNHKWADASNGAKYDSNYHVVTFTPSYRFKLDSDNHWGLRLGLGLGFSVSNVAWANNLNQVNGAKVANGAGYVLFGNKHSTTLSLSNGGSGLCPNVRSVEVTDDLSFETDDANSCLDSRQERLSGASNYAIAAWLKGLTITKDDLVKVSKKEGDNTAINREVDVKYYGLISDKVTNSCVWGMTEGCYMQNGKQNIGGTAGKPGAVSPATVGPKAPATVDPTASGAPGNPGSSNEGDSITRGSGKGSAGFVIAPQVAVEYDNGVFHTDISARYMHALKNVKYSGKEGSSDVTYTNKAGPLAFFIGAGLGVNF